MLSTYLIDHLLFQPFSANTSTPMQEEKPGLPAIHHNATSSNNSGSSSEDFVLCPVCGRSVILGSINDHLDSQCVDFIPPGKDQKPTSILSHGTVFL